MEIRSLSYEQAKHVRTKLKELSQHDGWAMVLDLMAKEREDFFRALATPTAPRNDTLYDYNRGIIEACYRLSELPTRALAQVESIIKLHEATNTPATAGKTEKD